MLKTKTSRKQTSSLLLWIE